MNGRSDERAIAMRGMCNEQSFPPQGLRTSRGISLSRVNSDIIAVRDICDRECASCIINKSYTFSQASIVNAEFLTRKLLEYSPADCNFYYEFVRPTPPHRIQIFCFSSSKLHVKHYVKYHHCYHIPIKKFRSVQNMNFMTSKIHVK